MVTPAWNAARLLKQRGYFWHGGGQLRWQLPGSSCAATGLARGGLRSLGWLWLAVSIVSGCDSSEHNFKRELVPVESLNNLGLNPDGTVSQLLDDPEYSVFIPCANEYVPSDVAAGVATLASEGSETCFSVTITPAGEEDLSHDMQGDEFYVTPTYDADRDEYDVQLWWLPQVIEHDDSGGENMAGGDLAYKYYYRIQPLSSEQAAEWHAMTPGAVQGGFAAGTFAGDTTVILTLQMMNSGDAPAGADVSSSSQESSAMASLDIIGTATLWLQYNKVTDSFAYSSGAFGHFVKVYDSVSTHDASYAEPLHGQDGSHTEITPSPSLEDPIAAAEELPAAVGMVEAQQIDSLPADEQDQVQNMEPSLDEQDYDEMNYQSTRFYTQVATHAITVSWEQDLVGVGQLGVVDFEYRLDPAQGWQSMGLSSPFVIESLEPSQLYRLQLRSVYSLDVPKQVSPPAEVALSTLSQEHAERAQESPPATEKLVFSVYPHADTVEVSWRIPRVFDVTKIIDYQYQLVQSGSAWQSMGLSGFYEIKNLQPGQIYVLKFRVVYADGPSGEVTASIKTLHHPE